MIGIMYREENQWGYIDDKKYEFSEISPEQANKIALDFLTKFSDPQTKTTKSGKERTVDKSVLYITDLDLIGASIVKGLSNSGYSDCTETADARKKMPDMSYSYLVSGDMGKWFGFTVQRDNTTNCIYALENVLPHLSKDDLTSYKDADQSDLSAICETSLNMIEYLSNLCKKDAMTISSYALKFWSSHTNAFDSWAVFPDMHKVDCDLYGCSVDEYLRNAYKGGWCYMKAKADKIYHDGITLDVNSLYPFVMKYRKYPIGQPIFWVGDMGEKLLDKVIRGTMMAFYHISCRFKVKKNYLPFVQIPGDFFRQGILSDSTIRTKAGHVIDEPVELTFTQWELDLFLDHYDVTDFTVLDGCCFRLSSNVFDAYVDRFYAMKMQATKDNDVIMRTISKYMMNALSGTLAKKHNRQNCILDCEGNMKGVIDNECHSKSFIQLACCITSYARCMMIQLAQSNYSRFLYCDTDSLHLVGKEVPSTIRISNTKLGQFKIERRWNYARFVKTKVYIEEDYDENFTLVYAGCPYEVQKEVERKLKSQLNISRHFGVTRRKLNMSIYDIKLTNIPYTLETPNGTFKPDVHHIDWHIDLSIKKDRERLKLISMRRRNTDNYLSYLRSKALA